MGTRGDLARVVLMTRPVSPDSHIPIYVQIGEYIAADIKAGRLRAGQRIPSENDMVQEFGVARDTARRTVQWLRDQGLVMTVPHRGTFVEPVNPL